ncbi:MAG: formate dehydrogenase [Campylobacteraceae bacterium 4484_166]|nr:MAG: formate dehydrogenase [Campylobacteraceae bacterium 4484_166]
MTTDISSVCCYCGVGCDITAIVKENKIEKIYAQNDGYVSRGKLCIKGKTGFDFVHSKDRLKEAKIKISFIKKHFDDFPRELKALSNTLIKLDDIWFKSSYEFATSLVAWRLCENRVRYGKESFFATGGARTSCESGYLLQKFTRETMQSPHIDNCARVCHAPSLNGLASTIGEGAATNPYDDIYESEFLLIIGSNTTEAHPIVANRMIEANKNKSCQIAVCDVRMTAIGKKAKYQVVLPFEANLLFLNCLAYVIIKEKLYNKSFINKRTKDFEKFKNSILNDNYSKPEIFEKIAGYENITQQIYDIARDYAKKKSMIFWGLGVTEHIDGSFAVMAMSNLSLLTGNIGKTGTGLMPLRGQNNVQGACDMGCLPYYLPDYQKPKKDGLKTPDAIDAMIDGTIKTMLVVGEDVAHIHPNQNKINKALKSLDMIVTFDLFLNEIAKKSDIVFGVQSSYEKTGVYVNAMRRLHLSQPLVENNLLDDWQILRDIENKIDGKFRYKDSEDVWNDVRKDAPIRYSGATYQKLMKNRQKGLQWPVGKKDTPVLHIDRFNTKDGLGKFIFNQYSLRNQIKQKIEKKPKKFYLTTGRVLVHYNNIAQTSQTNRLMQLHEDDILLVSQDDFDKKEKFKIVLKSKYGESNSLGVKITNKIKSGTMFCSFHHKKSKINYLFGDESDINTKTASFKSIEVQVEQIHY